MDIAVTALRVSLVLILGSGVFVLAGAAGMCAEEGNRRSCRILAAGAYLGVVACAVVAVLP